MTGLRRAAEIPPPPALADPWERAALWGAGTALALLTETEGPSYRDPGAALAISQGGETAGAITSGCVEADLLRRAAALQTASLPLTGNTVPVGMPNAAAGMTHEGAPEATAGVEWLRYGLGSPFFDLRLPCGGGITLQLFVLRDTQALMELSRLRAARRRVALHISTEGRLALRPWQKTGRDGGGFVLGFTPAPRFVVLGQGAEIAAFARLLRGLGHAHLCLVSEGDLALHLRAAGSPAETLDPADPLACVPIDEDTAVTLFFHDHERESGLLPRLLGSPAFYIGAQGSRATQSRRLERLEAHGVPAEQRARLRGPIGLIPSTRDPETLALSVLAEVMTLHAQIGAACRVPLGGRGEF